MGFGGIFRFARVGMVVMGKGLVGPRHSLCNFKSVHLRNLILFSGGG